jgi:uncharacterized membrane protein
MPPGARLSTPRRVVDAVSRSRGRDAAAAVVVLLTTCALLLLALPATGFAKSYSMPEVVIEATVRADGAMVVRETRTFDFDGDFTFVYWDLESGGSTGIEVHAVSGPEGEYARTDDPGSRPPRTWWASGEGGGPVRLEVYLRQADTRVPITIEYLVRDAATKWDDTAELYWKFIGDDWDHGVARVEIHVALPPGVVTARSTVWSRARPTGRSA